MLVKKLLLCGGALAGGHWPGAIPAAVEPPRPLIEQSCLLQIKIRMTAPSQTRAVRSRPQIQSRH